MKITEQVTMIVAGLTRVPAGELCPDTGIFESRLLTSLGLLDLVDRLEREFKIIILPEELIHDHFASIATITGFIGSKLAEAS
ncbi:phosphopantetheine-binding protein [Paenibacillus piscarius]|uniref:phosphopantetheine-binding protein n=1 Tax=Paenibacillus piscarius TaxID=1089681 RepID=UPI001EE8D796|nr:phosphopantetheine-binding protein [Paenibacillus piscarius]